MELWEKIRSAIDEAELSQKELAELCDVSPSTVSMWFNKDPEKRSTPNTYTLMKISSATGVPIREFTNLLDKETHLDSLDDGGDAKEIPLWERLRIARKKRNLNQTDLAEACSITRSSIANWESPDHPATPKPKVLRRIAEVTNVSYQWLSGETASIPEDLLDLSALNYMNEDIEEDILRQAQERKEDALHVILDLYTYVKEHGISQEFYDMTKNLTQGVKRYCK